MDTYAFNTTSIFYYDGLHELCRICGRASNDLNSLFDDNGSSYDFSSKVNEYLPITVRKCDYLPQKICSSCVSILLSFHQLYLVCQSTNARFLQSLEGDAYEHHVIKNQAPGDTSELLELQSSFSREIDQEILLNMHGVKEAYNEAGSEIAANAAVRELERIGSSENITLVEDAAIPENLNPVNGIVVVEPTTPIKVPDALPAIAKKPDTKKGEKSSKAKPVKKPKANGETGKLSKAKEKQQTTKKLQASNTGEEKEAVHKENAQPKKNKKLSEERNTAVVAESIVPESNGSAEKATKQESIDFQCDYCVETFVAKPALIEHIKDVHNDLIFHCDTCGDYVARIDLISHMLSHALSCPSIAVKGTELKPNKIAPVFVAPKSPAESEVKPNETTKPKRKYTNKMMTPQGLLRHCCTDCDKTFSEAGGLRAHINTVHNKIRKYKCDICGSSFSCKRIIANHIRGVHMKERLFECTICSKKFSTDSALYMHKKIHEDVLNCVCEVCDRRFRSTSKLKIHMTMHTKVKNFFCAICNRGFAIRNNLTKHLLTHSKTFDFKCTQCDYRANQRRYLADHIKRIHNRN